MPHAPIKDVRSIGALRFQWRLRPTLIRRVSAFLLILLISLISLTILAHAQTFPNPTGFVNDYTGTISNQTRIDLESSLKSYEQQTGREISVAVIQSLEGTTVEDYAVRLFEQWKIGKKGEDNGALFLVALAEHKLRIEVGYGLEGALTDAQSKLIIDNIVTPSFKSGDYDRGVSEGVDAIIKTLNKEPLPQNITTNTRRSVFNSQIGDKLIWLAFVGTSYFFSVVARSKKWWAGGVWGGIIGTIIGILAVSVTVWLIATGVLGIIGLIFDFLVSRAYHGAKKLGKKPPWWAGGSNGFFIGGGSGGSGGGFGGFGGGSSGGGGASGRW